MQVKSRVALGLLVSVLDLAMWPAIGADIYDENDLFEILSDENARAGTYSLGGDITVTRRMTDASGHDLFSVFTGELLGNGRTIEFQVAPILSGGKFENVRFAGVQSFSAYDVCFSSCVFATGLGTVDHCLFSGCTAENGVSFCQHAENKTEFEKCRSVGAPIAMEADGECRFNNCHAAESMVYDSSAGIFSRHLGGIVGKATSCEIESCSWDGGTQRVLIGGYPVGGIVGDAVKCKIANCQCMGNVKSVSGSCGGIVGNASECDISGCSFTGMVLGEGDSFGGLAGIINGGSLRDSTCVVEVSTTGNGVGGVVGKARDDVKIENVVAEVKVLGGKYDIGGFVGHVQSASITRCSVKGEVSTETSVGEDSLHAYGGFAGSSNGATRFQACSASCAVKLASVDSFAAGGFVGKSEIGAYDQCCATGDVSAGHDVGGFAGSLGNNGMSVFENCFATGEVEAVKPGGGAAAFIGDLFDSRDVHYSVVNCFAAGKVKATSSNPEYLSPCQGGLSPVITSKNMPGIPAVDIPNIPGLPESIGNGGGVMGITGKATASFWNTENTGMSVSGLMGEGKTLSEMKNSKTYTDAGWDFSVVWEMSQCYPRLRNCNADGKSSEANAKKVVVEFFLQIDPLLNASSSNGNYCQWSVDGYTWYGNRQEVYLNPGRHVLRFKSLTPYFENPDTMELLVDSSDAEPKMIRIFNPTRNYLKVQAVTDSAEDDFDPKLAYWYVEASTGTSIGSMENGDATHHRVDELVTIAGGNHKLAFGYDAPADSKWDWQPVDKEWSDVVVQVEKMAGGVFENTKIWPWTIKFHAVPKTPAGNGGRPTGGNENFRPASVYSATKAQTLHGSVYNGSTLVGIIDLKVGKPNKKNEARISGSITLRGGERISLTAVKAVVSTTTVSTFSIPIKNYGSMSVTLGAEGFVATSTEGWKLRTAKVGGPENGRMVFKMGVYPIWIDNSSWPVLKEYLPMSQEFTADKGKWKFPKGASISLKKGTFVVSKGGEANLSAMKLTSNPKKGTFKGSFKVYTSNRAKLRKYSASVNGVVADGEYSAWIVVKKVRGNFTGVISAVR